MAEKTQRLNGKSLSAPPGISYRPDLAAWWPDYDHAPVKCMQFVQHGLPAIDVVLKYARGRDLCVQAGGHAGFWPKRLAESFRIVHTFEPEPLLYQCLIRNSKAEGERVGDIVAYPAGLGAVNSQARFKSHCSAGSWRVDEAGETEVQLVALDSLTLTACDAIMLDIEGYEVKALRGAAQTIAQFKPVILCELLPRSKIEIEDWLRKNGYALAERYGRDGIYTYRG